MKTATFYAEPQKAQPEELALEIRLVSQSELVSGLLNLVNGVLAVVNEKRQVVAYNDSFMKLLGVDNPAEHLGLRPGEILSCIEADKDPAGCGTTKQCRTCGAAIAMVTSLADGRPAERMCSIQAMRGDRGVDIALMVKAHPIVINAKRFILLFLQDVTRQQQQAALERTFFHDVSNLMSMLLGASEVLLSETNSELAQTVHRAAARLRQEVNIQRHLCETEANSYTPMWHDISCREIFDEIESFFSKHPAALNKHLVISNEMDHLTIRTDLSLTLRILCNMITNGFEEVGPRSTIKVWAEQVDAEVIFNVWNEGEIPKDIQGRVFQKNFSTKEQSGRGIGTFSMKLFGENILGGRVNFTSSANDGTTFRLAFPRNGRNSFP